MGILYATPERDDRSAHVRTGELATHLRERYWIGKAPDRKRRRGLTTVGMQLRYEVGRSGVGRSRSDPGDGFWFNVRLGASDAETRAKWYEVTEAFLTVHPKELNAFMRGVNGLSAYPGFDPARFLASLDLARPSQSTQRRAADAVVEVVESKLTKESYGPMLDSFG